jgi:arabinose-5-phosphate isomerase
MSTSSSVASLTSLLPVEATSDVKIAQDTIATQIAGLDMLSKSLDKRFSQVVDNIMAINGRVIVTGMGKSGHVGRKIAAILASTGTPSFFVHPAEASHGDMGMITPDDIVIAISNGGEAPELHNIIAYCTRFRVPLVAITAKEKSTLGMQSSIVLKLPDMPEACPLQKAPTTSATMTMVLGDALAIALMKRRNFNIMAYTAFHPGGSLGGKLIKVSDVMRQGDILPLVQIGMTIGEILPVMSKRHDFGVWGRAVVVDQDKNLLGYFSDGDVRRNMSATLLDEKIETLMNKNPLTIDINATATAALAMMNEKRVTELVVLNENHVRGVVRLHDILAAGAV